MYRTGDVIDNNDLAYVIERFGNPRRVLPAPISRFKIGEHKGRPKINPHVSSFLMKDGHTVSVFHVKPVYYLHINGEWRPLSEVTTHHGNRKIILNNKWEQIEPWYLRWLMKRCELIGGQVLIPWRFDNVPVREGQEIYFTVTTVYPDPDPETTTVDGTVEQNYALGSGLSWANIRVSAGSASNDTTAQAGFLSGIADNVTSNWQHLRRSIFLFDTTSIPDTDTISAVTLSLWGTAKGETAFQPDIHIVLASPASNTSLVGGDFAQAGYTTAFCDTLAYASFSTTAYNDFSFNATGISNTSKTAVSKFSAKSATHDSGGTTANWVSEASSFMQGYYADQTGTTNDPKLVVTHAGGPVNVKTYIGLASASTKTVNGLVIASVKTWDNLG